MKESAERPGTRMWSRVAQRDTALPSVGVSWVLCLAAALLCSSLSALAGGAGPYPGAPQVGPLSAGSGAVNAPSDAAVAQAAGGIAGAGERSSAGVEAGATPTTSTVDPPNFTGTPVGTAWTNLTNESSSFPSARSVIPEQFVYDPVDGYFVQFGGFTFSAYVVNDTWTLASGHWTQLAPAVAPPPLDHASMAWDAKDGYLLLFGGATSGFTGLNETWKFLHGVWTQLHPAKAPSPRWGASMAWDPTLDALVLFGGCANHVEQNDTWTYVGGTWTNVTTIHSPTPREDASIAFDAAAGYLTVFGGENPDVVPNVAFNDTWEWSQGQWTNITTAHSPSPRYGAGLAYFPTVRGLFLYGGSSVSSSINNQSWYLRGGSWSEQSTLRGLPSEAMGGFAAGPDYSVLLFGGAKTSVTPVNSTWEYYALNLTVTPSAVVGDAPLDVAFGSTASGGRSLITTSWAFGDGVNGSGSNVTHEYRAAGNYTVSVHAEDGLGVASAVNFTVEVLPPLLVSASAGPLTGTAPLRVTFNASAEGGEAPYAFVWTPTPGISLAGATESYAYSSPGTYTASLTVNDSLGVTVARNLTIQVNPATPPTPAFSLSASANRTEGEAPFAVQFNASASGGTSPYTLAWTFGDGTTSNLAAPTYVYTTPGRYVVALNATDSADENATAPHLTVVVLTHVAIASGLNVQAGHTPLTEEFTGTPSGGVAPYTLIWTFGDGSQGSGASTSHTYPAGGSYTVTVEAIDALGDTAQASVPVSIAPAPASSSSSPAWYASATTWEIVGAAVVGVVIGAVIGGSVRGGRRKAPTNDPHPESEDEKTSVP